MDLVEFKKLAAQLRLPSGGHFYGDSWSWNKRGGHAGIKTIIRVLDTAEASGWTKGGHYDASSPDGGTVGRRSVWVSPEGYQLQTSMSYGVTAHSNSFSINLTFAQAPVVERRTMKLTQRQLRQIVEEAVLSPVGGIDVNAIKASVDALQKFLKIEGRFPGAINAAYTNTDVDNDTLDEFVDWFLSGSFEVDVNGMLTCEFYMSEPEVWDGHGWRMEDEEIEEDI